jgi:hypothetical protein
MIVQFKCISRKRSRQGYSRDGDEDMAEEEQGKRKCELKRWREANGLRK